METAAFYLRLSQEDGDRAEESQSIGNQRVLLTQYCAQNGFTPGECYVDDGYTGTNYNRPGFQRLLRDIESGKVKTVLTKDLSRLGRDYIETGRLVECYFPQKGVRYIAVGDGVDTGRESAGNDMSAFKAVFNDFYAKDVSKKVRAALTAKRKAGEFIGAGAPYGYQKDPENPKRLIINPSPAAVVRQIYQDYIKGKSVRLIAQELTENGVPTPVEEAGRGRPGKWNQGSVRRILSSETYIGNLVQNRTRTVSYKVKKRVPVSRENWIVVEKTHEAIVTKEEFLLAQQMMKNRSRPHEPGKQHLLSGLAFCGGCGSPMTFVKDRERVYLVCANSRRYPGSCQSHCIREDYVEGKVFDALREITANIAPEDLCQRPRGRNRGEIINELREAKEQLAFYERTLEEASRLRFGNLIRQFEGSCQGWRRRVQSLETELMKEQPQEPELACAERLLRFHKPPRAVLVALIKKITVYKDKSLDIQFAFPDPKTEGCAGEKNML